MSQDPNDVPGHGRVGGVDDPVPRDEYRDEPPQHGPPDLPDDPVGDVVGAGLLTEKQAAAYIMRDVLGVTREDTAEEMDISANVLDKHLRTARDKVVGARATLDVLVDLQRTVDERQRAAIDDAQGDDVDDE